MPEVKTPNGDPKAALPRQEGNNRVQPQRSQINLKTDFAVRTSLWRRTVHGIRRYIDVGVGTDIDTDNDRVTDKTESSR